MRQVSRGSAQVIPAFSQTPQELSVYFPYFSDVNDIIFNTYTWRLNSFTLVFKAVKSNTEIQFLGSMFPDRFWPNDKSPGERSPDSERSKCVCE